MKKTITLFCTGMFCFCIAVNAQINKGSTLIGGTLNLYSSNFKNPDSSFNKQTSFSVSPSIGFAIDTNTVLGFSLSYGTNSFKGSGTFKEKYSGYGAGVFLRKYKLLLKDFYLFGEGDVSFNYATYNYSSINSYILKYDSKAYGGSINFSPGLAYNLTKKLQLEAGLQNLLSLFYSSRKENSDNTTISPDYRDNTFSLNSSLNPVSFNGIFFGLRFFCMK